MKPQGSAKGQQEEKMERGGITAQNKQNVYICYIWLYMFKFANTHSSVANILPNT